MKTSVTFRSGKFPPYDGEEEQINPGLWGKRLAEYLAQRLPEHGVKANEASAEDWGWYLPVMIGGKKLAVCCGHQSGDDDQFLCFTDPAASITRKWFKKIDLTQELTQLVTAVDKILRADPEVHDIKWS